MKQPDGPILAVDDEVDSREMLATLLRLMGHAVVTASNGLEALEQARKHRPWLILLDLMMPIMDGVSFMAEHRADVRLRSIPVLLLTASYNGSGRARAIGARGCVPKPIDARRLAEEIARLVERDA